MCGSLIRWACAPLDAGFTAGVNVAVPATQSVATAATSASTSAAVRPLDFSGPVAVVGGLDPVERDLPLDASSRLS